MTREMEPASLEPAAPEPLAWGERRNIERHLNVGGNISRAMAEQLLAEIDRLAALERFLPDLLGTAYLRGVQRHGATLDADEARHIGAYLASQVSTWIPVAAATPPQAATPPVPS